MQSHYKVLGYIGLATAALAGAFYIGRARAAGIPDANVLTYTGYLEGSDGQPLTGDHSISVRFWESEEATSDLCTGETGSVTLQAGRFQVPLPDECTDAVKANPNLFVDVTVDGASLGRTKLGAVPFAVEAGHATSADDATHAATADEASTATGALAAELGDLDDAIAGVEAGIPKITAWASFDPTIITSVGSAVSGIQSKVGKWRRVGDSVEVQMGVVFNQNDASLEYLNWALPNNLVPADGANTSVGTVEAWNGQVVTACMANVYNDQKIYVDCNGMSTLRRTEVGVQPKINSLSMTFTVQVEGWTLTTP